MQPTLLITILLALLSTSLIATDSSRSLANCGDGCLKCSTLSTCQLCQDDLILLSGQCVEPYVYKDMIYFDSDHFSWVDIDNSGVDIAVIIVGAICAAAVYIVSALLMYRQDWKAWVPESKEEATKNATATPKEPAKMSTPKGDKVIEMGEINGHTATTKTGTPSSPERKANSPTRPRVNQEEEEEEHLERTAHAQVQEVDEEDEEPYYPNQKELETRSKPNRKHHQEEEEEDQEDQEEVEIQVHDAEEDEAITAQETPSPKTDYRSSQRPSSNKKSHKRNDSHHSDAEEVESPQKHHHDNEGEEEEEEEEEFESARSKHASNEEEEEEQEEEEDEEPQDIMDLNDLGLDGAKKHTQE